MSDLTGEQIDVPTLNEVRADYVREHTRNFDSYTVGRSLASEQEVYGGRFDALIAAIEDRAARRERERIIAIMRDAAMVGECITSPHICLTDTIYEIEAARIARGEHR